ncbi:S-layer homology domain-containing protein [Cohnella sp.]|uniref:S-layer homology domain-containing protein n=1 Tax=Cohnella sp. TaxID=1883426 RepID=UPI003568D78B
MKRILALFLSAALVFSSFSTVSAQSTHDIDNHWASEILQQWVDKGWISGYEDGTIRPDASLTRAEFAALINRVFQLKESGDKLPFVDLTEKHWAYKDIAVAYKAGYLKGTTNHKVLPNGNTSRQEAAVILANLLKLETLQDGDISMLSDSNEIASWARGAVAALAGKGILVDTEGGIFRPKALITRAEVIVAMDAAIKQLEPIARVFDKPGVYGSAETEETIEGDVVISADGVTLQNFIINGSLKLAKEIGDGDVNLNRLTVNGTTRVQGGGKNSIHFKDSKLTTIVIERLSATVRVVMEGTTTVTQVSVLSGAIIELIDSAVIDVVKVLKGIPKATEIDLIGSFEVVEVEQDANAGKIKLGKNANIIKIILHAAFHVIGEGTIQLLVVNSEGIVLDKAPTKVEAGDGVPNNIKYSVGGELRTISSSTGNFGGGGGPIITPPPAEDKTPPILNVSSASVEQGISITISTNEKSNFYWVPEGTSINIQSLNTKVVSGEGGLVELIEKDEFTSSLNSSTLAIGKWLFVAVDEAGNLSEPFNVEIKAPMPIPTQLAIESFIVGYYNNQELMVNFNKKLKTDYSMQELILLKAEITIVDEDGELVATLKEEDTIMMSDKTLKIFFPGQFPGKNLRIKIMAGAVRDIDGLPLSEEYVSSPFSKGISFTQVSDVNLHVGDRITFSTDEATDVFFMSIDETGIETLEQYHEKVQEGKARLIKIEPGQLHIIHTRGLLPGTYALRIWQGVNVWFNILPSVDQTSPILIVPETTIDRGDPLFVSTNESTDVYWVPEGTTLDIQSLEDAVAKGNGGKHEGIISSELYTPSIRLTNTKDGKWLVVAADDVGNLSQGITITIAEPGTSKPNVVLFRPDYNHLTFFHFNKGIKTNLELEELKNAITISKDNGATYNPFPGNVSIHIGGSDLTVIFNNGFSGSNLRIKIAAGAIEDLYGNELTQDYLSPAFSAGTVLRPVDSNYITEGQKFSFKSNREGPVFLMEAEKNASSLEGYYELVSKGEAILIDVIAADINKAIEVDTSGLDKGRYNLRTWKGPILRLNISVTYIDFYQIEIDNNLTNKDIVTINDVEAGDIINFYNDYITHPLPGGLVRTVTVPMGKTSVILSDMELNDQGGFLYVTITKPNLLESDRYAISYLPATDLDALPTLIMLSTPTGQGEPIIFRSKQRGTVYFVPSGMERNLDLLNDLVKRVGTKIEVNRGDINLINPAFYSTGEWWLLAVDEKGNISEPYPVTIQAPLPDIPVLTPLAVLGFEVGYYNNQELKVEFNRDLKILLTPEELAILKGAIRIIDDNGESALKAEDSIELTGNTLKIFMPGKFPGQNLRLKIPAGAIQDEWDNLLLEDYVSELFSKGISFNIIDEKFNVHVGESLDLK